MRRNYNMCRLLYRRGKYTYLPILTEERRARELGVTGVERNTAKRPATYRVVRAS